MRAVFWSNVVLCGRLRARLNEVPVMSPEVIVILVMESKVVSPFVRFVFEVEQEFMKTGYFIVDKWLYTPLTGLPPVHLDLTAVYTDSVS